MATSSNTTGGVTAKKVSVAEEKVNDKTVAGDLDKAAKKSDEVSKKAVWNKANDGAVEAVMGADSWPALSDKGNGHQKSSVEPSRSLKDLVVPSLQGTTPAHSPRKQVTSNPQRNSTQSNAHPARQKSFKGHGGSTSSNTSSPTQPLQSPPPFSKSQSSSAPSNRNTTNTHKNLESTPKVIAEPQLHGTNDRPQHNNFQKKGTGPHQHGDGSSKHRHGAKKDHDRPNRNWNIQGSGNGRDTYPQPAGGLPRGVTKHLPMPHSSGMFVPPPLSPTMQAFGPPVSYPEFPFYYVPVPLPPESIRGFSVPHPAMGPNQMLMQYIDPELHSKVLNQIDYYFSNENLVKDIYLRNNMDEEGWVSLELIAGFKQVKKLTNDIALITEVLQTSTVVEVQDDKVRRRNDWSKWLVPGSLTIPSPSDYRDPVSSTPLAAQIQKLNVGQENADIPSASSPSGDPSSQQQGQ